MLFDVVDSFTEYYTCESQIASSQSQRSTVGQPNATKDDEFDRVADEFNAIWLSSPSTDVPIPRTLLRPRIEACIYNV